MTPIRGSRNYGRGQDRPQVSDSSVPMSAPTFDVPERKIVAVDHPYILLNLENGLQSFGPKPNFDKVSDCLIRAYNGTDTDIVQSCSYSKIHKNPRPCHYGSGLVTLHQNP